MKNPFYPSVNPIKIFKEYSRITKVLKESEDYTLYCKLGANLTVGGTLLAVLFWLVLVSVKEFLLS